MPDVGTLNITIQSDAEQAAQGLKELAGALSDVHKAAPNGLNLAGISGPLNKFAKAVKDNSKPLANIGTFLNAITNYKNAFKKLDGVKFNRQPIDDLKAAVGDGIKIGQAGTQINKLREALGGEWNTDNAEKASAALATIAKGAEEMKGKNLGKVAEGVSAVAKALEEYAVSATHIHQAIGNKQFGLSQEQRDQLEESARKQREWVEEGGFASGTPMPLNLTFFGGRRAKQVPGQVGMDLDGTMAKIQEVVNQISVTDAVVERITSHVSTATNQFSSFFDSERMIEPYKKIADQMHEAEKTSLGYANAIGTILPKVNQHNSELMIEAGNARLAAMSEQALATAIAEAQGLLQRSKPTELFIQSEQIQSAEQFNIVLNETGDIVTSVLIPRFQEMYETWSMMAYEFGAFQMQAARLVGGNSPLLLGDGRTPGQLMLGDGMEAETFLSTWVQAGETFKTNWVDFTSDVAAQWRAMWSPDWILGGWQTPVSMSSFHLGQGDSPLLLGDGGVSPDEMLSTWIDTSEQWKQNWIAGEGTVSDAIDDTQQVAAATREAAESAKDYGTTFASILEAKREEAELAERIRAQQEGSFYAVKPTVSMEQTNAMSDNLTQLDLLQAKLREAEEKYNEYVNTLGAGSAKTIKAGLDAQKLRDAIWEYKQALEECADGQKEAESTASRLSAAWESMKGGITRMFPTLTNLLKRFKSMMVMRSLRYVIRSISKGFSEGVQNVYQYSKAVGTSFAPAMDQAATALQLFKNSIGAAVAPVIQALIPVFQNVVNWVIAGINYLNQFFALLNGQSAWTRALPEQAEAFEKSTKSAKGASKAMKDLLADWDELNIIQSQNSGGAGSGASKNAEEYKNMFEEVSEFDQRVKDVVAFIDEHLGGIPGVLKKAGAALLAWKLSKAFTGDLMTLKNIAAAGGVILSIVGIEMSHEAGYDIGKNDLTPQNLFDAIKGIATTGLGGALIGMRFGGFPGAIAGFIVGAGISIYALEMGLDKGRIESLYGNVHKDVDDIRKELEENFLTIEAKALIDILDASLKDTEGAKTKVQDAINDLNSTYPVGVKITPDNKDDFALKVQNLVTETNALIAQRKANFTLYTPASAVFKSKEDFDLFSKNAWNGVSEYVEEIGNKIGKILNDGIEDELKLDELREKLLRISAAVLNAQEQSNFVGKVSASGSSVRNGAYDYETVKKYMEEYNTASKDAMDKAIAYAQMELEDKGSLVAALQETVDSGKDVLSDEEYQKAVDDLEKAKAEYDAFFDNGKGVMKRAQEYFDAWTSAGRELYSMDIFNALQSAMAKNKGYKGIRSDALTVATAESAYTTNESDAEKYKEYLDWYLMRTISTESGMPLEEVKSFIENSGIDPLSFFDDDFVKQYQDNVISWLGKSRISDDQKEKILAAVGLDFDESVKQRLQEVFDKEYNSAHILFNEPVGEDLENMLNPQKNNERPWWDFLGLTFVPPETDVDIPVNGNAELENAEEIRQQVRDQINYAMADGIMHDYERDHIVEMYGQQLYEEILKELQYNLDEEGYELGRLKPAAMLASGIQEYNGRATPYTKPQIDATALETESMTSDVAKGTAQGNESQNELIQQLITIATRIANKDFTIKITPDSSWGAHNARSNRAYGMITGETQ